MTKSEFMELEQEARAGLEKTPNDLSFIVTRHSLYIRYHNDLTKYFSFNNKKEDVLDWVKHYKSNNFLR